MSQVEHFKLFFSHTNSQIQFNQNTSIIPTEKCRENRSDDHVMNVYLPSFISLHHNKGLCVCQASTGWWEGSSPQWEMPTRRRVWSRHTTVWRWPSWHQRAQTGSGWMPGRVSRSTGWRRSKWCGEFNQVELESIKYTSLGGFYCLFNLIRLHTMKRDIVPPGPKGYINNRPQVLHETKGILQVWKEGTPHWITLPISSLDKTLV